jgi:arginase
VSRRLVLIGAPTSAASYAPGQERAPAVLRDLGLIDALRAAGRTVEDAGDGPLHVWAPDPARPRAQNVAAVIESLTVLTEQVRGALAADADVLVLGGNCTVALAVMAALRGSTPEPGLLYLDRQFDLNTPESTSDGALDWMGLAHALDLPGVVGEVADALGPRPLLRPAQLALAGVAPELATPWERDQAARLELAWSTSTELADDPSGVVAVALRGLPEGPLAVHLDVDVLDFIDAPLAENTDGRNTGPSLAALAAGLRLACADPRFRALSVGEVNPSRAAGSPEVLDRFVGTLVHALAGGAP